LAKLQKNVEANRQKDELYAAAARVKPELTASLPDTWEAISDNGHETEGKICPKTEVENTRLSQDCELDEKLKEEDHVASSRRGQQLLLDFRRKLPSYQKRVEVIDLVHKNQVILISGETGCGKTTQVPVIAGLWIRIDLIRIRIQHFCSIRIRFRIRSSSGSGFGSKLKQNFRRQFSSQIFLKSKFESNQIKNTDVIHQNFFQKVVNAILYLFSGKFVLKK
jgi:type IV secretory pathway ATPase VirB11/archaellum biosynthesis ATPase